MATPVPPIFGAQPSWEWGDVTSSPTAKSSGVEAPVDETSTRNRANPGPRPASEQETDTSTQPPQQPEPQPQPRQRHYRPRTCRICLEVVPPTFEVDTGPASTLFGAHPRVRYVSEEPELGRLISPCKCKGSQRYVHEGCLQAWRNSAPLSDRNYWSCPTCKFQYRMDRLRWASWLSSRLTRAALTLLVLFVAIFLLGFVADPIINIWIDPVGTVMDAVSDVMDDTNMANDFADEPFTWSIHFIKGILSLGLLGCVKAFVAMSPWQWWHIRSGGMLGGGANRRGTGRDRIEGVNLALVVIGLFTFLAAVWKGISVLSARTLEKVSDRVLDVQGDDDEDDFKDDEDEGHT